MYFKHKTPFVTEHPITRELSITNHAFINIKTEEQIIDRRMIHFERNLDEFMVHVDELKLKITENIKTIRWKKGLCIFVDNFRFMHGRLPYNANSKRNICIMQLKRFSMR